MYFLHPPHGFLVERLLVPEDFDGCVHFVGVPTVLNDGSKFSRCSEHDNDRPCLVQGFVVSRALASVGLEPQAPKNKESYDYIFGVFRPKGGASPTRGANFDGYNILCYILFE